MEDKQDTFTCPACGFVQPDSGEQCIQCGYTVSRSTSPFQIGTILESRYRIDAEVGRGGMGVVYRGTDLTLSRPVAIKAMLSNRAEAGLLARFMHEARSLASVEHRRLVPVYAVGQEQSVYYMVMRFVEGRPLSDVLAEKGQLEEAAVVRMIREVCDALQALHMAGLVHRDIKPANLMVEPDGSYTVMDLGIAKESNDGANLMASPTAGTPKYMPPEMFSNDPVDGRADLYALGIVAYHALTGEVPFDGPTPMAILYKQAHVEPTPIRQLRQDISKDLAHMIHVLIQKQPLHRYADAEGVLAALDDDQEVVLASGPPIPLILGLVGLLGVGAWFVLAPNTDVESRDAEQTANQNGNTANEEAGGNKIPNPEGTPAGTLGQGGEKGAPTVFMRLVQSNPPGAEVYRGDEMLGVTPFEIKGRTGNEPMGLDLRLKGYEAKAITISFSGPGTDTFELKPARKKPKKSTRTKSGPRFELVPE